MTTASLPLNRKQRRAAARVSPFEQAVALHQAGGLAEAEALYRKAIAADPRDVSSLHNLGLIAFEDRRLEEAERLFARAAQTKPDYASAWINHGAACRDLGRLPDAAKSLQKAIALSPDDALAHTTLGMVLRSQGRLDEAKAHIERALALAPSSLEAHYTLAGILLDQEAYGPAIEQYAALIGLNPSLPDVWLNRGVANERLGRMDEAIACYDQVLALSPDHSEALYNLGVAFQRQGRLSLAAERYRAALAVRPALTQASLNLGLTLLRLGRQDEAVDAYSDALVHAPEHPDALLGLGEAYERVGRVDAAIDAYKHSLRVHPANTSAWIALGSLMRQEERLDEAVVGLLEAVRLAPNNLAAWSQLTSSKKSSANWVDLGLCERKVLDAVRAGERGCHPFVALIQASSPAEQLAAAQAWTAAHRGASNTLPRRPAHTRSRLRVGYVSADFRKHATAYLATGLFEAHDRSRFETIAYSINPPDGSAERQQLEGAFDRFVDISAASHDEAARAIWTDEVDILVDLKGHTGGARTEIFAQRPAPIQVNYLGYPGTMGADFIDYILVDPFIVPATMAPFFTEALVQLPVSYQPNMRRPIAEDVKSRADHGLPEGAFVFCSFNQAYKITPEVFNVWMRLLGAVPGSVLWLLDWNRFATANLRAEAAARGIDPARLVFAPPIDSPEHLARHRHADLFLDTAPVCAHTTASDALWAGLPLVSCVGDTFVSRVSGSLLLAVGLPDLITDNLVDYEALALSLAQAPARLAQARARLNESRATSPLFDSTAAARAVEAAFEAMWRRHERGETPAAISVAPHA